MIRAILDSLTDAERKLLMYAFENGISQHVDLVDNHYIGVNVEHISFLKPEEKAGKWSYGTNTSRLEKSDGSPD